MKSKGVWVLWFFWILYSGFCILDSPSGAELIDRVAAFVDDKAITLSELKETFEKTRKVQPDISRSEVLNTMINRVLLLTEAERLRIGTKTDDELINEYIELKVRAFVRLKEKDIEDFYRENEKDFGGAPLEEVREKIERLLTEREVNRILKSHIAELRSKAYVKIMGE